MKAKLQAAMKEAMKAKEKVKLETIRGILSAIQYEEMQTKVDELGEQATIAVLQRELKKRQEELEFAEQAKREDLKEKLKIEMSTIEAFLPQQLSDAELEKIISGIKEKEPGTNMGAVMKLLQKDYSGRYNGKAASEIAKRILG